MKIIISLMFVAAATFGGWLTHIVNTIQHQEWVFMIAGALLAPVAVVHGWSIWLGYDWLE